MQTYIMNNCTVSLSNFTGDLLISAPTLLFLNIFMELQATHNFPSMKNFRELSDFTKQSK